MKQVKLPRGNLFPFIEKLKEFGNLYAPVSKGTKSFVFDRVEDPAKIEINYEIKNQNRELIATGRSLH